ESCFSAPCAAPSLLQSPRVCSIAEHYERRRVPVQAAAGCQTAFHRGKPGGDASSLPLAATVSLSGRRMPTAHLLLCVVELPRRRSPRREGSMKRPVLSHQQQPLAVPPFRQQLLKWIGSKQRFAHEIVSLFPRFRRYWEPFLGSGAVLGTLAPKQAVASD